MGDCVITLQSPSKNIRLGSAEESTLLSNYLEVISDLISKLPEETVDAELLSIKKLRRELIDIVTSSATLDITKYGDPDLGSLWPNTSVDELRNNYKFLFGKNNDIPVLLINSDNGFDSIDPLFFRRVKIGAGYVYVVPEQHIKEFADYTVFKDEIERLRKDYPGFKDIYDKNKNRNVRKLRFPDSEYNPYFERLVILSEDIVENMDSWTLRKKDALEKKIENHIKSVKKKNEAIVSEKNIDKINKGIENNEKKIGELEGKLFEIQQKILQNKITDKQALAELNVANIDYINQIVDLLNQSKSAKAQIQEAQKILEEIENGTFRDEFLNQCNENIKYGYSQAWYDLKITELKNSIKHQKSILKKQSYNSEEYNKVKENIKKLEQEIQKKEQELQKKKGKYDNVNESIDGLKQTLSDPISLIEYFIDNYKNFCDLFPPEIYTELYDICKSIKDGRLIGNNVNPAVSAIRKSIIQHNSIYYIELDTLRQLISNNRELFGVEQNVDISNKIVENVLNDFYGAQIEYRPNWSKNTKATNRVYLKKYISIAEQLGVSAESLIGVTPIVKDGNIDTVHGKFIYEVHAADNSTKYFWNDSLLNYYSYGKVYESREEAVNALEEKFLNLVLSENSTRFTDQYNKDTTYGIPSPKGKYYHRGDIIRALDYEYGNIKVPQKMDVKGFYSWLDTYFAEADAKELKERLQSIDLMVAFYSKFGGVTPYYLDVAYDETINGVLEEAKVIENAKYKHFMVMSDTTTVNKTGRSKTATWDPNDYYTIVKEVENLNLTNLKKVVKKKNDTNITYWEGIKKVFGKQGVIIELLSDKEIKEKFGFKKDEVVNGVNNAGVIYINIDVASIDTPFHEYTHLLLALVKRSNKDGYEEILNNYVNTVKKWKSYKSRYEDYHNRYKEVYKLGEIDTENPDIRIIEEMFADDYAAHLRGKLTEGENLFRLTNKKVSNTISIFDNLEEGDLENNEGMSLYTFLNNFSNRIRMETGKQGILLPIGTEEVQKSVDDFIQENIKDAELDSEEEGILRKCKE